MSINMDYKELNSKLAAMPDYAIDVVLKAASTEAKSREDFVRFVNDAVKDYHEDHELTMLQRTINYDLYKHYTEEDRKEVDKFNRAHQEFVRDLANGNGTLEMAKNFMTELSKMYEIRKNALKHEPEFAAGIKKMGDTMDKIYETLRKNYKK
jgi:hypothetical protein